MLKTTVKTAQDIQDEIFMRMSAEKKISLTCDLAECLIKLNQLNRDVRFNKKNSRNFGRTKN